MAAASCHLLEWPTDEGVWVGKAEEVERKEEIGVWQDDCHLPATSLSRAFLHCTFLWIKHSYYLHYTFWGNCDLGKDKTSNSPEVLENKNKNKPKPPNSTSIHTQNGRAEIEAWDLRPCGELSVPTQCYLGDSEGERLGRKDQKCYWGSRRTRGIISGRLDPRLIDDSFRVPP